MDCAYSTRFGDLVLTARPDGHHGASINRGRSAAQRAAFTLVELLVVVTIIGLLVALLLPAVQTARAAARRAYCVNNLRQCGLSILNYESSRGEFPPSGQSRLPSAWNFYPFRPHHSWCSLVLPYLEEQSIHDAIDFSQLAMSPANRLVGSTVVRIYRCPDYDGGDHSRALTYTHFPAADGSSGEAQYAIGNYVALGATDVEVLWRLHQEDKLGILHPTGDTRYKDITDGVSHTYLIVESREPNMRVWIDGRTAAFTAIPNWSAGVPSLNYTPYYQSPRVNAEYGPSSRHPGGANHVFADGSTRFVTDDVTFEIYTAQTTFSGGEVFGGGGLPQ